MQRGDSCAGGHVAVVEGINVRPTVYEWGIVDAAGVAAMVIIVTSL